MVGVQYYHILGVINNAPSFGVKISYDMDEGFNRDRSLNPESSKMDDLGYFLVFDLQNQYLARSAEYSNRSWGMEPYLFSLWSAIWSNKFIIHHFCYKIPLYGLHFFDGLNLLSKCVVIFYECSVRTGIRLLDLLCKD